MCSYIKTSRHPRHCTIKHAVVRVSGYVDARACARTGPPPLHNRVSPIFADYLKSKSFYLSERMELSNKPLSFSATSASFPLAESFSFAESLSAPKRARARECACVCVPRTSVTDGLHAEMCVHGDLLLSYQLSFISFSSKPPSRVCTRSDRFGFPNRPLHESRSTRGDFAWEIVRQAVGVCSRLHSG